MEAYIYSTPPIPEEIMNSRGYGVFEFCDEPRILRPYGNTSKSFWTQISRHRHCLLRHPLGLVSEHTCKDAQCKHMKQIKRKYQMKKKHATCNAISMHMHEEEQNEHKTHVHKKNKKKASKQNTTSGEQTHAYICMLCFRKRNERRLC